MRIVITGASDNIGTAVLRRLGEDAAHKLVGISRRTPPAAPPYAGVEWHERDIGSATASTELHDVMSGADAVVHLAWLIQPSHDRQALLRTNQVGTQSVMDAARRAGPTAVDKAACERLLDEAGGDLVVSRVRPALVLQPDAASEISRYFLGWLVPVSHVRRRGPRGAPGPLLYPRGRRSMAPKVPIVLRQTEARPDVTRSKETQQWISPS